MLTEWQRGLHCIPNMCRVDVLTDAVDCLTVAAQPALKCHSVHTSLIRCCDSNKAAPRIDSHWPMARRFQILPRNHGSSEHSAPCLLDTVHGAVSSSGLDQGPHKVCCPQGSVTVFKLFVRRRAVTSISIFMRGSARPATNIVAAGGAAAKQARNTGQHGAKSSR